MWILDRQQLELYLENHPELPYQRPKPTPPPKLRIVNGKLSFQLPPERRREEAVEAKQRLLDRLDRFGAFHGVGTLHIQAVNMDEYEVKDQIDAMCVG